MIVKFARWIAAAALVVVLLGALPSARAELAPDKIGIVMMHGKLGTPLGGPNAPGGRIVFALRHAGYLVATPEMCWSRYRRYDKPYPDCVAEVDSAIATLKSEGAVAIVVSGLSLGGNATLRYAATHPELLGAIGFNPADDPHNKARNPEVAAVVAHAQALMAQGKGDETTEFLDTNTGPQGAYKVTLDTTPRIYLSFYGPGAVSGLADNAAQIRVPLLWVKGGKDPTQRNEPEYAYDKVPANPLNKFIVVPTNHIETPDAAVEPVLAWLKALAATR